MMLSTVILRTASRFIVPLGLLFAAYIYFKGHNTPGGGFVGGLVASVAMIVQMMCHGRESLVRLLPVRERTLIGLGLFLALLPGVGSLFFGLPFLTTNYGYLERLNHFEWTTAMVFDLGVVLVVCGVVVGMINALAREKE